MSPSHRAQRIREHDGHGRFAIRQYRFPSGLEVLISPDRGAPIATLQVWYRVGSRHERAGQTGIAHFFEHLMFGATTNFATGEFDRLIESNGGDCNAATWVDWTHYRDTVPTSALETVIQLEADRMQNLELTPERVEAEREVIVNERLERVDNNIDGFIDEQLFAAAFDDHPYRCPTIGWMEDIRALDMDTIHRFYRSYYAPNNATLIVVGDVVDDDVLALIDRYFGDIAPSQLPTHDIPVEPAQDSLRREEFVKPTASSKIAWGFRAPPQNHPDWTVLSFIASLLSASPSCRLYKDLVIDKEIASWVDCDVMPFCDPSLFRITVAGTRGADPAVIEGHLQTELTRLVADRVDDAEMNKVKNGLETDFWSELEGVDGRGEAIGHYHVTVGDFGQLFDSAEAAGRVTADDVARVAAKYLCAEHRTDVVVVPESTSEADSDASGPVP